MKDDYQPMPGKEASKLIAETLADFDRLSKPKDEREATVELPAEPAPAQPNYDDVPF